MAIKSTIFKAALQVSDLDRHYYAEHALTLARHPSETDERMMVRVLAFVLNAHPQLEFGRGISSEDEPDLWRRDLTGQIEQWIEVGLPDERRLRRACGRADEVLLYAYGARAAEVWWASNARELNKLDKLKVALIDDATFRALGAMAARSMQLQATLQDSELWLSGPDGEALRLHIQWLKGA